jgi:hypothetical protein
MAHLAIFLVASLLFNILPRVDDGVVGLLGWLGHERTDRAAGLLGQLGLQQANQGKRFGPNWTIQ